MLNIPKLHGAAAFNAMNKSAQAVSASVHSGFERNNNDVKIVQANYENLQAYHPSFLAAQKKINAKEVLTGSEEKYNAVKSKLDRETLHKFESLIRKGIILNNDSNDRSSVLDNLYKIVSEPRFKGLSCKAVLAETISALDNPFSITQKFGDIPRKEAIAIEKETGEKVPDRAKNVVSSACVAANMEFGLAYKKPAEFARFAADLSSRNYSVQKNLKPSDFSEGFTEVLWKLREFNAENQAGKNNIKITFKPDKKAAVRAKLQTKFKDKGERSCVDVLIQSALLNFGSQHTYNALTDERTGKYNPDKTGLTDFEKNFTEQAVFETPKLSVVYQNLDENGYLTGYHCTKEETKQHILKSLQLGQNVIIGYTHLDKNKKVNGGHEITILGYEPGRNGFGGSFICNDSDDGIDAPVKIKEEKLLPLIHHAGISKEALNKEDIVSVPWKEYLSEYKNMRAQKTGSRNNAA